MSGRYPRRAMPREISVYLKERTPLLKFKRKIGNNIISIKTPLQKVILTLPNAREGFCDMPLLKPKPNIEIMPSNTPNIFEFIKCKTIKK